MDNTSFDNEKITNTQLRKLLVFDMVGISIIILPGIASAGAGRDGLIALLLGSAGALAYGLFFVYASGSMGGEYMDFGVKAAGKFLMAIFGVLYAVKLLFSCWFALTLFSSVINDTLLPNTNEKVISFILILVSIYIAAKSIEVRARLTEVFFFVVLIPLVLLFIFGLKRVELTNLFPLFTASGGDVFYTGYSVFLTYSALELLLFTMPALAQNETSRRKPVLQAVIIAAAVNAVLFILVIGLLGVSGAERRFKSSIMIMQLIQIPGGFVQRQDAIMLTIWMFSIFAILGAFFHYLSKISKSLTGLKSGYSLVFFGILVFALCCLKVPAENLFDYYGKYMAYIGLPQSLCIPLLIILASKIRGWKGGFYAKKD